MQSINVIRITDSYTMKSILWHSLRVVLISGIFKAFEWIKVDRRDWEIEKWNVWKANSIVKSVARFIFVSPLLRPRIIRRWMVVDKLAVHFYAMEKKKRNTCEQAGTYMLNRFALVTRAILQIFIAEIFSSQSRKLLFRPRNLWSAIWFKFRGNLNYWQVFQEKQTRFDKSETWWRICGIYLSKRTWISSK